MIIFWIALFLGSFVLFLDGMRRQQAKPNSPGDLQALLGMGEMMGFVVLGWFLSVPQLNKGWPAMPWQAVTNALTCISLYGYLLYRAGEDFERRQYQRCVLKSSFGTLIMISGMIFGVNYLPRTSGKFTALVMAVTYFGSFAWGLAREKKRREAVSEQGGAPCSCQ